MVQVLYVLTLVTTLVMPTHLLTGIFGMNWQDDAGKPVVPGLGVMEESRGYYLFWGWPGLFGRFWKELQGFQRPAT